MSLKNSYQKGNKIAKPNKLNVDVMRLKIQKNYFRSELFYHRAVLNIHRKATSVRACIEFIAYYPHSGATACLLRTK